MPKDFKKMFLDEQNAKLKTELEMTNLRKELEEFKKNQAFQQQFQTPNQPQPEQQTSQFENDVRYIVELCQRMSVVLRKCRTQMLPLSLGKEIDVVLREMDRL